MKNSNDTNGNRTRAVPQPTAPTRAPLSVASTKYYWCGSVLVLVILHANRRVMLSSVTCPLQHIFHIISQTTRFKKNGYWI